ncbi:hypothetical protein [Streptomyces hoynatensis]|uniref:Uncharacterized protein n=1 Tax=Streptomyces hoynatensis TaxID=1141874 RepID=A0A3A9YF73_9ACTN|nr:hypothetical protein [Streptomyces hoynatensis]RKN35812.1 hypothetical protein D7294_30860 [Streptomyces hoynatensis]
MNRQRVVYGAVSAGLTAWLIATAADQLPDRRFDGLLGKGRWRIPTPNWRFFGPNPGVADTHLLYRDLTAGVPGAWAEVEVTAGRQWYTVAWNARNRAPKVLFDSLQTLIVSAGQFSGDMRRLSVTPAYRLLGRYLTSRVDHVPGADHTQFLLLRSHPEGGTRVVEPMFASEHIRLPAPALSAAALSAAASRG